MRYGGPIYSVHGLCTGLARRGHDVHVMTTNVDGDGVSKVPVDRPIDMDGVTVTYFETGSGRRLYRSPTMRAALDRDLSGFDLVHTHSVFLWPTTAAASRARRRGVPFVMSPRGMLVRELIQRKSGLAKRVWIELFERRNIAEAGAVHVTSELEADEIRKLRLAVRRFAVVPNGIDTPSSNDFGTAEPSSAPTVLFLGRINWKKGLDRLVPAMAHVPGARLQVVGNDEEGYSGTLRELAHRHGLTDRMEIVGHVSGAEKWNTFGRADVFVLPSYSENFGIAVLEAMACGVPVIVTPEVGLARVVAETGAGLVVDGDPAKLGAAIAALLADPDRRRRMGEAGRAAAEQQFSWDAVAQKMEALYQDLIGAAARKPQAEMMAANE
jgi:glycosyltransferase involved in cell wall biosynthesis